MIIYNSFIQWFKCVPTEKLKRQLMEKNYEKMLGKEIV